MIYMQNRIGVVEIRCIYYCEEDKASFAMRERYNALVSRPYRTVRLCEKLAPQSDMAM